MNFIILFIVLFGGFLAWGWWLDGEDERERKRVIKCLNETLSFSFLLEQKSIHEKNKLKAYQNIQYIRPKESNYFIQNN